MLSYGFTPPLFFDVAKRVAELQRTLDDGTIAAGQEDNINGIIRMHRNGKLLKRIGEDGKYAADSLILKGTLWWTEICLMQNAYSTTHFAYIYSKGTVMQLMSS
jgi:hypothetical protein